jgi:hypothetical protein
MKDLHNSFKYKRGISPQVAVTDNTAFVSQILDTANYTAHEFVILTGSLADADATFTVLVEESTESDMTGANAVADTDLIGTEALASFTFSADNSVKKIGYIGSKRYVRVTVTPASNAGDAYVAGVWVQAGARNAPQS